MFVNTTYFHLHEAGHDDTYHDYYVQFIKPLNVKMRRTVKCLYVNVRRNGLTCRLYVINIVISYQINASGVFKYKSGTFDKFVQRREDAIVGENFICDDFRLP